MNDEEQFRKFHAAVYGHEEYTVAPYGAIQWKGTDVCIDIHCQCGAQSHIDGEFCYYFMCSVCGRKYALGTIIKMIPLTKDQAAYAADRHDFQYDRDASPLDR